MRIGILGAGAVGGYFGGRLVEAGRDVTFVVRPARKALLEQAGLRIESPAAGDFAGPVRAMTQGEVTGPFDIVLLTAKAYDLDGAIEAIAPGVGPETVVVPLLNGLAHVERLEARFGERVAGGLVKIAVTLAPDGAVRHLNDWQFITFGPLAARQRPRLEALRDAFGETGVVATLTDDIRSAMWEKLVHLATVAGMTTLMRANIGEIARTEAGASISLRLLEANAAIAAREGHPVPEAAMEGYRAMFADPQSPYTASMLRDIERGGPVEADHIAGFMQRLAVRHGLEPDLYTIVLTHLQAYEERRAAGRL